MFSGIVEEMATVVAIKQDKENIDFTLKCSFVDELGIDQSVAHNGVCHRSHHPLHPREHQLLQHRSRNRGEYRV